MLPPAQRALVVLKSTASEEALKALILRTSVIIAPPVDKAGRDEVHRAAMEHKNARLAIEHAAKAATEDAKEFTKSVSAEQKRLIALNAEEEARLFKLRDDYDEKIKAEKEAAEKKERERVAAIKEKIEQIAALHLQSADDSAADLAATIDDLQAFEVTFEDFAEFQDEAKAVVNTAIVALSKLHERAVTREAAEAAARETEAKLAAERAEIERQKRELEEQRAAMERERAAIEAAKQPPKADDTLLEFEVERKASLTRAEALADEPMSEAERARHIEGHNLALKDDPLDPNGYVSKVVSSACGTIAAADRALAEAVALRAAAEPATNVHRMTREEAAEIYPPRVIVAPEDHVDAALAAVEALPGSIIPMPMEPAQINGMRFIASPELRMNAYYFQFEPTGVREVDMILSAIADAGHTFHHTEDWNDENEACAPHVGKTPVEWIQNAANAAAETVRNLLRSASDASWMMDDRQGGI
jgi:hypothetical protein